MASAGPSVNNGARDPGHRASLPIRTPLRCRLALHRAHERSPGTRRLRDHIPQLVGDDRVLEVGCGYGDNAPACAAGYLGIDTELPSIERARRWHPGREFMAWDLLDQGPVPGEFDAVLLCLAVHELTDRDAVLDMAVAHARHRVIVADYDPALRGWLRLREGLLEKGKLGRYLRFDLVGHLALQGWAQARTEPLDDVYRWWVFEREHC